MGKSFSKHASNCRMWDNGVCTCQDTSQGFPPVNEHPNYLDRGDGVKIEVARRPGVKLDGGKPKVVEFFMHEFPHAIEAVAEHGEHASNDPGHVPHGWKEVENGFVRYTEALGRHLACYGQSNIQAAVARAWNAMAALEHLLIGSVATESSPEARDVV